MFIPLFLIGRVWFIPYNTEIVLILNKKKGIIV